MNERFKSVSGLKEEHWEQRKSFREFVNHAEERHHKPPTEFKPTGYNRYMDEQNRNIDKHNLRK